MSSFDATPMERVQGVCGSVHVEMKYIVGATVCTFVYSAVGMA